MFQIFSFSKYSRLNLKLILILCLISKPLSVVAEPTILTLETQLKTSLVKTPKSFIEILQDIAANHAVETGIIDVNERWTRIEFSSYFIDPIVVPVIKPSNFGEIPLYMIGIRNIDSNGFEVSLKLCDNSTGIQISEVISYTVIESDVYLTSNGVQVKASQRFLWQTCAIPHTQDSIS